MPIAHKAAPQETGKEFSIKWSILKCTKVYMDMARTKTYNLCLAEKLCVLKANKWKLLNKRYDILINKCQYPNNFQACNFKIA